MIRNEINKTFELFADCMESPELKQLVKEIQIMYNEKEKYKDRINKAIEYNVRTNN